MPGFLGININDNMVSCSIFSLNSERVYSYYEKINKDELSHGDIVLKHVELLPKVFSKLNKKIRSNIFMVGLSSLENQKGNSVGDVGIYFAKAIAKVNNAKYAQFEFLQCLILEALFLTNKLPLINKKFLFIDSDKEEMNIYVVNKNLDINETLKVTKENCDYTTVVNFFMNIDYDINIVVANNDFKEISILDLDILSPENFNFVAVNKKNISIGVALLAGYKYERLK